ncbi:uncharacterized protein FMAN_06254 [Fusarium mangiferae]|uniref:Uncharacterized protein n=1 Tax=Fusarium mangiferae TaxID=192010 RepID=A0A1L7SJD4_FUSMA|nr:uncharacterized protein FMAN_06254 [Fusarium mangiferae]CVK86475.1 uncharacterized protein FMAN_06254 [Fusarium mangiferae]
MSIDSDDDSGWLDNVSLITQHHKVFIVPRVEQEEANDFNVDFEEKTRISDEWDTALGMEYAVASPISIENVTSVIEGRDISDTEWENKFVTEFAWICEFLPPKEEIERRHIDRFLFCKAIFDLGSGRGFNTPDYRDTLRALHNRRRLWELCSKIVEEYLPLSQQRSAQKPEANSSPEAARSRTTSSVPTSTPSTIDFFRKPIKSSRPWPCEPHELRNKSQIGASSMETLILAARGSDLTNATRFGVDANMQRFEIHLEENGRKWSHCIGLRSTAMQYLYFDKSAAVPDRITSCYVTMQQNVPSGLRFISQSQTITAGKPEEDEMEYPPQTNWGGWMTGIFCQWSDRDSPDVKLASFDVYFADE